MLRYSRGHVICDSFTVPQYKADVNVLKIDDVFECRK